MTADLAPVVDRHDLDRPTRRPFGLQRDARPASERRVTSHPGRTRCRAAPAPRTTVAIRPAAGRVSPSSLVGALSGPVLVVGHGDADEQPRAGEPGQRRRAVRAVVASMVASGLGEISEVDDVVAPSLRERRTGSTVRAATSPAAPTPTGSGSSGADVRIPADAGRDQRRSTGPRSTSPRSGA